MTSEFSAEATHFRGKTLTPESPVPLHIPEPSHIPVLQNQIDPIFNLMSTHMDHPSDPRSIMGSGLDTSAHPAAPIASAANTNHTETANKRASNDLQSDQGDKDYVMAFENEDLAEEQNTDIFPNHSSSSADQLSAPIPAYETFLPSTHNNHPTQSSTQSQEKLQRSPPTSSSSHQPSQDAHRTHNLSTARNFQSTDDGDDQTQESGINYQALLDNLSPSTATALSAETITSITATAPSAASNTPRPSSAEPPISALPLPAGLPPRPPPQEKPAIHPNYTTEEDIRSYHYPHVPNATSHTANTPQSNNAYRPPQGYTRPPPPNTSVGSNGLPPPPVATFQQSIQQTSPAQPSPTTPQSRQADDNAKKNTKIAASAESAEGEVSWTPEIEKMYADFLNEEAVYVAEGLWDRFPPGSRLFVGNLYSEKVTKKDLFNVFHKYGRLAQVSIKNAYGFVQYHDANCSQRALQSEQGATIRGRKIHLEISKPQKNSRNAAATSSGDSFRAGYGRRSRSPEYGRGASQRGSGQRMSGDRVDRGVPYSNFGGEPRRRDDYRPLRSPSPRSYRPRDDYRGRDRSPDRYYGGRRSRSRSPYGRNGRYRSNSPRGRDIDDETNLPIPRRDPRNVPEVQIVLVDEVDRTFVAYIEKTFRDRGMSCGVLQLQRLPLAAVVKRQIIEGVQAVVKILRQSQLTGKIPLQVFDHSGGVDHVRYEEYDELDAHIAAELVLRAKGARLAPSAQQPSMPGYGAMRYGQPLQSVPPPQPQSSGAAPNIANLITSLDGPSLQKLLGAINPQSPQNPSATQFQNPQQPANIPDLAALLGNNTQQHQQPQTPQHGYPHYPQTGAAQAQNQAPYSNYGTNTALAALLGNTNSKSSAQGLPQQHQGQPGQQQNVQSIMEQLARYKQ